MALTEYLKTIADAIRAKKGTTETINAQDFATEIVNLPSGGNSNVIEVSELPTENIDESKIYIVNELVNAQVYYFDGEKYCTLFAVILDIVGVTPTINHYVVNELPTNAEITDLQTFSTVNCYIFDNVAYVYGNAGAGNMWLTVSAIFAQMGNTTEDKGRVYDLTNTSVEVGLYVYYEDKQMGVTQNNGAYVWNGDEWFKASNENIFRNNLVKHTDIGEARCYKSMSGTGWNYYKFTNTTVEHICSMLFQDNITKQEYCKYTDSYKVEYDNNAKDTKLYLNGVGVWLQRELRTGQVVFITPCACTATDDGLISISSLTVYTFSPNLNKMFEPMGAKPADEIPLSEWEQALTDYSIDMDAVAAKEAEFNS